MKVAINTCYGGFGLSLKAIKELGKLMGKEIYFYKQDDEFNYRNCIKVTDLNDKAFCIMPVCKDLGDKADIDLINENYFNDDVGRTNYFLIRVIEKLGEEANGRCSKLKIVEIPDDVEFDIQEYDGMEWVAERHRTWE